MSTKSGQDQRAACTAKDLNAYADAYVNGGRELDTQVCDFITTDWDDTYEQVDQNTWVSNAGPEGLCKISSTGTIWRRDAHDPWSLKSVTTTPPNATGPLCLPGTEVDDYLGLAIAPRALPCKYLKM